MSNKNLIPQLRFPEFKNEGEWVVKELNDFCFNISSGKDKNSDVGKYELYGSTGIIGRTDIASYNGDYILVARVGANAGLLNRAKGKFGVTDNTLVLDLKKVDIIDFIQYSLYKIGLNKLVFGSGQPLITGGQLKSLQIATSKNETEQQKIASCLSSLDEVITSHSKKLDLLKAHKKGLMQNLFPQESETVPKFRFKDFNKNWEKVKLKDVSTYFNGGSYENDVKEEGKYELITLKSIDTSGKLVNSKRYIDVEVPTLINGTLVMILSEQAPGLLGMTAIIPENNKYVLNQRVAEIRPNQKVISFFLSMAINRNQVYFSKQGAGMKVQNITKPNVENYEFLVPEIHEQQKIASCLSSLDSLIIAQAEKIEQLKLHKKGLMQGLFPKIND